MAEGISTFKGLAVPLQGESEITALSTTYDVLTITGAAGSTGDLLVLQNSSGTELFVVEDDGQMAAAMDFADNIPVVFGTGDDVSIAWDGTDLDIVPSTKSYIAKIGTSALPMDVWFHGSGTVEMVWDGSLKTLSLGSDGNDHSFLNMGVSATAPSTPVQGSLFTVASASTAALFRLGICTSGTTIAYLSKFDKSWGSNT